MPSEASFLLDSQRSLTNPNLFNDKERLLLNLMFKKQKKQKKRLAIKKTLYKKLTVLEIQNYLTRDYHYFKWYLVEILEF